MGGWPRCVGGNVSQVVEILAHVSGVGGQLGWAGLGHPVCGLDFEYGNTHAVVQGHGLGSGVRDAILEVRKVVQLGEAFYLYEFLGN